MRPLAALLCLSVPGKSLDDRRVSSFKCPAAPDLDSLFEEAMLKVRRAARGAIAPVACVQAVRAAATLPYAQGMEREKELMATLFRSGQARALQYFFFAQRAAGRWSTPSGARWDTSKPRPVRRAAVIGERSSAVFNLPFLCVACGDKPCSQREDCTRGRIRDSRHAR